MPLFNSFSESAARGLGVGSGKIMPPEPPVIVTPASGNPIIDTKFSADVLFTPSSPTTYPISSHRYRLIKTSDSSVIVDWTTVPSNPFTISSLAASTNFTLYMTAIDNQNVESVSSAGRTFTTKDDILIQAPIPSLTSPSITYPTSIYIGITYSAGIPTGGDVGGNTITLRQYAVTTSASTPATYSTFPSSSGTVNATTTTAGAALTTNTQYYVHFKYTDSTSATNSTVNSIFTAAQNSPGIPAASTFTKTGTSTATLQRGDATAGTYDRVYQYRYWKSDASSSVAPPAEGWLSMTSNPTFLTGLDSDSYYDAQVKAVSVSPGTASSSPRDYSVTLTDPNAPEVPVVAWHHTMTSSMANSAYLRVYPSTNATYVKVSRNGGLEWTSPARGSSDANFTWVPLNQMWIFSETGLTFNTTYTYQARAFNRVNVASSYSGNFVYTTARKNIPFNEGTPDSGYLIDEVGERPIVRTDVAVGSCKQYHGITMPAVPATADEVGYRSITSIGISAKCGNNCNPKFSGRLVNFAYADNPTTGTGYTTIGSGNISTLGSSYSTWFQTGLSLAGSTISGKTLYLSVLGNMANLTGCYPSYTVGGPWSNYFWGYRFYLQGTYTGESLTSGTKATSAGSVP